MRLLNFALYLFLIAQSAEVFGQTTYSKGEKIVRNQCGACHIKSLPTANLEALKIFNLEDTLWAKNLTDEVRKKIIFNIEERISLSALELSYLMPKGHKPLPKKPTKLDVAAVKKFLKDEKAKPASISDYISF